MFNHFDAFFDAHVSQRRDLKLEALPSDEREPFPWEACLWILRASNVILDNCSNKHMYCSAEHLASLLASDDADVALAALRLLASATRRAPGTRGNKFRPDAGARARLMALCGELNAASSAAASENTVFGMRVGDAAKRATAGAAAASPSANAPALHFVFNSPGGSDEALGDLGPPGRKTIVASFARVAAPGAKDHDTTAELAKEHGVPAELRFSLFARVRLARLAASEDRGAASDAVLFRLLAFVVLLQSERPDAGGGGGADHSGEDAVAAAFLAEPQPEFIAELLKALRLEGEGGMPASVVEASLRALAALAGDRAHSSGTILALRGGGNPAVLAAVVTSAVTRLTNAPSAPIGRALAEAKLPQMELDAINREANAPVPLAEALVGLLSTLVISHGGCQFLRDVSLLPTLLPLLKNRNPRHVHVVSHAVHVLEIFMDYASAAAAAFRELGGMEILVERLKAETEDALAEHRALRGGGGDGPPEEKEGAGASGETNQPAPQYLVSSTRRVLIKALMRALALTNFAAGANNVKVAGLEDGSLSAALNLIFENARLFGAGVFSLAANLLCDVMNHEPTCYPKLDSQGVPRTFLEAWESEEKAPAPSGDALCCLPNALGALCLSPAGFERVSKSKALDALTTAFTTRAYAKALQGDTASVVGGNLDELLRHVPGLQANGVKLALDVLKRLVVIGGGEEEIANE